MLALFAIVVGGCKDYQDDIDALDKRVSALETWQKNVNTDIANLRTVVGALEKKDYVTAVTALADGTGYTITFQNSGTITIHNGKDGVDGADGADGEDGATGAQGEKGDTPKISTKMDTDGKYYWTLDGEWLLNNGAKMPTSGNDGVTPEIKNGTWWIGEHNTGILARGEDGTDGKAGVTPQMRINSTTGEWELSMDDGTSWTTTGVKAQGATGATGKDALPPIVRINETTGIWEISTDLGATYGSTGVKARGEDGDSFFKDVNDDNADYVVFTLEDGTELKVLKYKSFKVGTDEGNEVILIKGFSQDIPLLLPTGFKETDYTAIMAQVISNKGTGTDIATRAASSPWSVTVKKPTFTGGICNNDASVTIKVLSDIANEETAILEVTLVGNNGGKMVATRALKMYIPFKGQGTENDPYLIYNVEDLTNLSTLVSEGFDYKDTYFKQMANIALNSEVCWLPIGVDYKDVGERPFRGHYDGNNHIVSDMMIKAPVNYLGLFGLMYGSVKNLTVKGDVNSVNSDDPNSGGRGTAGVCGRNDGTVSNCINDVHVTGGGYYAGGVCGVNRGTISSCSNRGRVELDIPYNKDIGGICGYNLNTISDCTNYGSITGGLYVREVGGICGDNSGKVVQNCVNKGPKVYGYSNVGGICGCSYRSSIVDCTNSGSVEGGKGYYFGGICGYGKETLMINCTNSATVTGCGTGSGTAAIGGICGSNYIGDIMNCNNTGTVQGTGSAGDIGGICGSLEASNNSQKVPSIQNCINTASVSGPANVGGVCGISYSSKISCCFFLQTDNVNASIDGVGCENGDCDTDIDDKDAEDIVGGRVSDSLEMWVYAYNYSNPKYKMCLWEIGGNGYYVLDLSQKP